MHVFFRCVAEAIVSNNILGLARTSPGDRWICGVVEDVAMRYQKLGTNDQFRAEIEQIASVSQQEIRLTARATIQNLTPPLPDEEGRRLQHYLEQIPEAIRGSFQRSMAFSGKSLPARFTVLRSDDVLMCLPPKATRFSAGMPLAHRPGWVLEKLLGIGGFNEVWLARNQRLNSLSGAVKFCLDVQVRDLHLLHESGLVDRVMAQKKHPNIVPLLDAHLDVDPPWLMYEYVAGGDLTTWIQSLRKVPAPLRLDQVLRALTQLAETVGYFHRITPCIVHRDLKPSNILLDKQENRLRITDFGIGGIVAGANLAHEKLGTITRGGRLLSCLRGSYTPLYASPQQRDGGDPDPRDDIHALGVIAYQMLTAKWTLPPGVDFADDLKEAGIRPELIALLVRCVSQNPDRRPRDGVELAELLKPLRPKLPGKKVRVLSGDRRTPATPQPVQPLSESVLVKSVSLARNSEPEEPRRVMAEVAFQEGKKYSSGRDASPDYTRAIHWYQIAADQGFAPAQFAIGLLYYNGQGVTQDYLRAMKWFQAAAEQKFAPAQNNIAVMYAHGQGVEQDCVKARQWYEKAAAQGFAPAQRNLGAVFHHGHGATQDYSQAMHWFQKAAEQGDAAAQKNIGVLYANGQGVEQDFTRAMEWYHRAASQGLAAAQYHIASLYRNGQGVAVDYARAMEWYYKAAEQGLAAAQNSLGSLYLNAQGITQDYVKAMHWFQKAADQGFAAAQCNIGSLYLNGQGVGQDYLQAMYWFMKAAEQGFATAQNNIGVLYENGQGMPEDAVKALQWYHKAALQGLAAAQCNIASLYRKGQGIAKNNTIAAEWFQKAADQGNEFAQEQLRQISQEPRTPEIGVTETPGHFTVLRSDRDFS